MNQQNLRGTPESAEAQGERFTRAVGCADNPDILECLRSKTVQEILNTLPAEVNILTRIEKYDFSVDGYTLLSSPGHALESGKFNSVPMIAGTTGNEASLFTSALNIKTSAQYEAYVRSIFGRLAGQVLARYPASEYANARSVLDALISDFSFVCPTRWLTRAVQEHQ